MCLFNFIVSIFLIFSYQSKAEETKDRLDTLMLKPIAGQLIVKTSYITDKKEFSEVNSGYTDYNDKELSTDTMSLILDYGINEKLNVFLLTEYKKEETTGLGSSDIEESDGLENPIFAFKYRHLTQEQHGYDFDIMVPVSFDIIDSEAADASNHVTGTIADGRDTIGLRFDLGKYQGDFGYLLAAGIEYKDDKSTYNETTTSYETATASRDYSFGFEIQYIQPIYSINFSIAKQYLGSYRDQDDIKYSFDDITSYSLKFNYSKKPEDYLISIILDKADAGNIEAYTSLINADAIKDIKSETITVMYTHSF